MTRRKSIVDTHFDTILLDFDGVIADTEAVFAQFDCDLLNNVLRKAGKEPDLTVAYVRTLAGMSSGEKLGYIADKKGFPADPYKTGFIHHRDKMRRDLFKNNETAPSPGLIPLLEHYRGRYALATNKTRDKIENDLSCMGLASRFKDRIFCYEKGLQKKPQPDILLHAAQETGMIPAATVYIGDNANDMAAAKSAGMIAAGFVCPSFALIDVGERTGRLKSAGADIVINELTALIPPFGP